jgi:hypothetical protein
MKGYLQRLLTSNERASGGALRPFVPSNSPIAELDQRVSIPGFDAAGLIPHVPASLRDLGAALLPAVQRDPAPRPSPERAAPPTGGGLVRARGRQSTASVPLRAGTHSSTPRRDSAAGRATTALPPAAPLHEPHSFAPSHPGNYSGRAGDPGTPALASEASVRRPTRYLDADVPASPAFERRSGSAPGLRAASTFIEDGRLEDAGLRLIPRAMADVLMDGEELPRADGPRLEIGTIQVEVVPPPRGELRAAPLARPLTAESVSQIGPLAARRRSNLRYALRQR